MKLLVKNFLLKTGLLYRIQYSHLYRQYKKPSYKTKVHELSVFYQTLFKGIRPSLVFDIGANIGDYSYVLSRLADRLICLEPDDKNSAILRARFSGRKNITVIKKAVAEKDGTAIFHIENAGSALNTLSNKWVSTLNAVDKTRFDKMHRFDTTKEVTTVNLATLIQNYGRPGYIKIDVEGFEKEVISGLQAIIPIISFECNLPEFCEETIWIIEHLFQLNHQVSFNFIRAGGFELTENITAAEISAIVASRQHRFLEIYCFN